MGIIEDLGDEPIRSEKAKDWQRDRARRVKRSENEKPLDYSAIVFPECPGLCQAARVIAGRSAARFPDLLDAIEDTAELLSMLGIIEVMNNGGDGRKIKVQRGPVRLPGDDDLPPEPIGYKEDDVGSPTPKVPSLRSSGSRRKPTTGSSVRPARGL